MPAVDRWVCVAGLLLMSCSDAGAVGPVTVKPAVDSGASDGGYPGGPYGVEKGQVLTNASFIGRKSGIDSPRETFDFESFRALRSKGVKLMVFNVAAFWCSPCKEEAKEFQASIVPKYGPKGVAFLSIVLQDEARRPTTDAKVDAWITTFRATFPTARDPGGFVNTLFNPDSMPLNMIINLDTMKVEEKIIGADIPRVTSTLDRLLGST
jgi:hypothetical protein